MTNLTKQIVNGNGRANTHGNVVSYVRATGRKWLGMRFGINLNSIESEQLVPVARAAEEAGFESVWLGEHIILPRDLRSPHPSGSRPAMAAARYFHHEVLTALACVAASTSELRVGTGVCLVPLRDPFNLARAAATVDRLSGGRLLLGVGLGWAREEYDILGIDWRTRGARLDEAVELLRELWSADTPEFHGDFYACPPSGFEPKPVQPGGVPVLVGAYSEAGFRRAARLGDGFFGSAGDPETALTQLSAVQSALESAGRNADGFDLTTGLGATLSPAGVERMERAGYTRIQAGILPGDDPFGELRRLRERFGSLMTR